METLKNSLDANRHRKIFKVLLVIGIFVLISTSCLTHTPIHPLVATNTVVPSSSSTPLPMTTSTLLALGMRWPGMPPIPTYSPLSTPTAFVPTPTMPMAQEPPPCTFPLPQTTTEEFSPENYVFSSPRVMITDENAGFDIAQWLPDSQRALIVRDVIKKGYEQYNSIELFNPRTVKVQVYGIRQPFDRMLPSWVAGLNAMIYPETLLLSASYDKYGNVIPPSAVFKKILWLSQGDPADAQPLEDAVFPYSNPANPIDESKTFSAVAVEPGGSQIILLRGDGKQLIQFKVSQGSLVTVQPPPFDLTQWDLRGNSFEMAWRPSSS